MGKGSNQTTTNSNSMSSTSPDSNAYQAYLSLLNQAGGVASTPYQGYTGQEVAPVNEQQQAGIGNINAISGTNSPFISQIANAGAPLTASTIQQYMDPYTNQVVDATQADFDTQNARANSVTQGNAGAQGALGGDRSAVAAALTQEGQTRAQAPVIAGLRSAGYQQAVGTAENEQKQALASGVAGQSAAQGAAGAQIGAGTLQQTTQQAQDTQARQDYYQQQGYPFQVAQWLASIDTGVGSNMGGTGTNQGQSTTTPPTPNPWTQAAGVGLALGSVFSARGGRISGVHGYAGGGSPYGDVQTWVPQVSGITGGKGAPGAPALPSAPAAQKPPGLSADQMKGIGAIGKKAFGAFDNYADPGSADNPLPGLTADDYGVARGGAIRRYANGGFASGGAPDDDPAMFDDRFNAAFPRMAAGVGAARPAFAAMQGDVINPDKPFRMLDRPTEDAEPPALQAYRSGVDQDQQDNAPLPPEVISGRSKPVMARSEPADDAEGPSQALGYSGSPSLIRGVGAPPPQEESSPESGGFLSRLGVHMTPELKQGLLQAGLAMMASGRGGPGSFLQSAGEAGMAGVGAYNKTQQLAQEQEDKFRKEAFEREKFERPYNALTAAQRETAEHRGEMTDFQKETLKRQAIDQAIKLKTPIQIDTSITGKPVMALPRIDSNGKVGLYPIDSQGNVSTTPIEPGGTVKPPSAASVSSAAETWKPDPKAQPGEAGSRNEAYLEQVRREDSGQAEAIKKAANYELDPAKYASMRRDQRQHFIDRVMQYDPNYNPQEVGLKYQAQKAFLPGTKNGDTITAFNTAISHLDVLKEMYHALNNGDSHTLNRLKNGFQQEFGYPAPNDVAALSSIIGGEVVKATVGAQNALGDREEVRASISRDLGKMQADSVIDKYQKLMGGQLNARKFAYEKATGLHNFEDHFLQPRSQEVLKRVTDESSSTEKPNSSAVSSISSKTEYDKLPSGAKFTKDGKEWTKP